MPPVIFCDIIKDDENIVRAKESLLDRALADKDASISAFRKPR